MKKTVTLILVLLMMFSCATLCFAFEDSSKDVLGKYIGDAERTSKDVSGQNATEVVLPDGTILGVENIPSEAMTLFIYSVPDSETEAWEWINGCFDGKASPIHTFDIYFADASGERVNVNGTVITIECQHCSAKPIGYSLNTAGEVVALSSNARSVTVTFTSNGSHYYVLAEALSEPSVGNRVEVKDTVGGKVEVSDKTPATGKTVTITTKPDVGKAVDKVVVTDKDGNKLVLKDNGDGSYSYEQPEGVVTVDVTFKNVSAGTETPAENDGDYRWVWIIIVILLIASAVTVIIVRKKKTS